MTKVSPSRDYVGKRVDKVTDTIYALYAGTHARRTFTTTEIARLSKAWRELEAMLRDSGVRGLPAA